MMPGRTQGRTEWDAGVEPSWLQARQAPSLLGCRPVEELNNRKQSLRKSRIPLRGCHWLWKGENYAHTRSLGILVIEFFLIEILYRPCYFIFNILYATE